jgi:hypothetical protein
MPHSELHKKKRKKNWAIFLALMAFMATVFFVTIIRMKGG